MDTIDLETVREQLAGKLDTVRSWAADGCRSVASYLERSSDRDERARYTLDYAVAESPFYGETIDGELVEAFDGVDDLATLPVVDRDDILSGQPPSSSTYEFRADEVQRPFMTSGSSGRPKVIFKSGDELDRMFEDMGRVFAYIGLDEEDDVLVAYLPYVGLNASMVQAAGGTRKLGMELLPVSSTEFPVDFEYDLLRSYPDTPTAAIGLPSQFHAKGMQWREEGYDPAAIGFETLIVGGEPVSESRKEALEDIYDAAVHEIYASTESGPFGVECHEGSGIHVLDDSVYVEIVDESGEPVDAGEEGRVVVTNLLEPGESSGMPLLRYDLGDVSTVMEEDCGCGHDGLLIDHPHRQSNEFLLGGVKLDHLFFEEVLYSQDVLDREVRDYQLVLDDDLSTGQDVVDVVVGVEGFDGPIEAYDVSLEDGETGLAAEIGRSLLDADAHLADTVDRASAVRLNVRVQGTDAFDHSPGKPDRVIDNR